MSTSHATLHSNLKSSVIDKIQISYHLLDIIIIIIS